MTQVFHLHDPNPLLPFPSISDPNANASPKRAKVKMTVEPLQVQAFDYAFNASCIDQAGSPGRRQPWLSSVLFSHDSKRRTFARSKLNHSTSSAHASDRTGPTTPRSPRAQFNTPAASRVATAVVQSALSLRSLEWESPKAAGGFRAHPQSENGKEPASSSKPEKKVVRMSVLGPGHISIEETKAVKIAEASGLDLPLPIPSSSQPKEKDLQIVDLPSLSSYRPSSGQGALFIQSKTLPMTPRSSNSSSNVRKQPNQPPIINLCDPVVPPLRLPSDNLDILKADRGSFAAVSERKLRFSIPNDTYYRIRGSESERSAQKNGGYVPYPISITNMEYSGAGSSLLAEATFSPSRPAKSLDGTPRSPMVLSRTVIAPAPAADARAQSAPWPKAKDHIVTAEMQLKGILIDASTVSASLCDGVVGNVPPMYSGAGPKVKSTCIGDKVWSRTGRNAAALDKL
jgi:hypothetical protein